MHHPPYPEHRGREGRCMHVRRESAFILGRKTCASLQRLSETQKSLKMRIPSLRQFMNASEGKKDLNEQVRISKGKQIPAFPLCHFRQLFPAFQRICDRAGLPFGFPLPRSPQTQHNTTRISCEESVWRGEQDQHFQQSRFVTKSPKEYVEEEVEDAEHKTNIEERQLFCSRAFRGRMTLGASDLVNCSIAGSFDRYR